MRCRQFLFSVLFFPLCAQAVDPHELKFSTSCDPRNDLTTLAAVGDVLIHKPLYEAVVAGSQHFSQIWRKTNPLIQKAETSVANLEGPAALGIDVNGRDHGDIGFVYDGTVYSGTNLVFNYHPRILMDLKESGYDLLTVANNHTMDRGPLGIDRTWEAARKVGIPTVGTRHSKERNGEFFKILPSGNLNIAFIGCTEFMNGNSDTRGQILFCYRGSQVTDLIKELTARSEVDAVIVLTHWGEEYQPLPNAKQKLYARRFIEAGALAVLGSHPHVLEPWEKYTTQDGREGLIVYSLGNFVANQAGVERKTGVVTYLGLSREGHQKARIFGVAYTPTYRNSQELLPVGEGFAKEVLNYAAQKFGRQNRLEPSQNLLAKICPQKLD